MNALPPAFVRILIEEHGSKRVSLWLPLFLLWPVFLAMFALALPFLLAGAFALALRPRGRDALACVPALFALVTGLRGLRIHVEEPSSRVHISVR